MMHPCNLCLENNWKYEFIEGWILATCQNCGNEVSFPSKKRERTPEDFLNKKPNFAEYENRAGRLFLLTPDWPSFKEVGLYLGRGKKMRKYLKIVPIEQANFKPTGDFNPLKEPSNKDFNLLEEDSNPLEEESVKDFLVNLLI